METRANHVLIGLFTLMGGLLLVVVALWSSRWASDKDWQRVEVHFLQPVSGLSAGSEVEYNGIKMGSVRELQLAPDDPSRVIALIHVDQRAPLRLDTTARLAVSGLTGVSTIQLRGGSPDSPPLRPVPGQKRVMLIAEESPLQRLIDTSEDIASTASEVMLRLLDFLDEDNARRIANTLDNVDALAATLTGEGSRVSEILAHVQAGSAELAPLMQDLRGVAAEVSQLIEHLEPALVEALPPAAEELQRAMRQLAETARRIDDMVARNELAIGGFGDAVLTPLGPAVGELRQLLGQFSAMVDRIERNPAGFLFGRERPREYQP